MPSEGIPPSLISSAYMAAARPDEWQEVCEQLHRLTDSPVKMLGHTGAMGQKFGFLCAGWSQRHIEAYTAHYHQFNPWVGMNAVLRPGDVGLSDAAYPRKLLKQTEFYNEWLNTFDNMVAGSMLLCHRGASSYAAIVVAHREGESERKLLRNNRLLKNAASHIKQAFDLAPAFRECASPEVNRANAARDPVILFSRYGAVIHLNGPAERMLREGLVSLKVCGTPRSDNEKLDGILKRLLCAMRTQDMVGLPGPTVLRIKDGSRRLAYVHLFAEDHESSFPDRLWPSPVAGALVLAGVRGKEEGADIARTVAAFGATPAEARLATAVTGGMTPYEYAAARGLSRNTVRNQMQALLRKTGARSQADLVRLLLSSVSPFR